MLIIDCKNTTFPVRKGYNTYEYAKGCSEAHHCYGDNETTLLYTKLHRKETYEVCQQCGKRQDKYRVEEC